MLVPVSQALEFGSILNVILRNEHPVQILFSTWILMPRHVNMLIYYLMTKYCFVFLSNFFKLAYILKYLVVSRSCSFIGRIFHIICFNPTRFLIRAFSSLAAFPSWSCNSQYSTGVAQLYVLIKHKYMQTAHKVMESTLDSLGYNIRQHACACNATVIGLFSSILILSIFV